MIGNTPMDLDDTPPSSPVRTTSTEPHGAPRKAERPTIGTQNTTPGTQNTPPTNRTLIFPPTESAPQDVQGTAMDVTP